MTEFNATSRKLIAIAAINAIVAVALGAFGAHGLENLVSPERLDTWDTAVQYQMMHVFGLFVLGMLYQQGYQSGIRLSAACFSVGILLFSGSLYLLVLFDQAWLGMITPLGGVAFLVGWASLAINFIRAGKS